MFRSSKIHMAGYTSLSGAALRKKLRMYTCSRIVTKAHVEFNLIGKITVIESSSTQKSDYVFLCMDRTKGIISNRAYPLDYLYINSVILAKSVKESRLSEIRNLLLYGRPCVYPKFCPHPTNEKYRLALQLEETNRVFALARTDCIMACMADNQQCQANRFIALVPDSTSRIAA